MAESMSPELLRRVGEALYGDQWQTPLSRELEVADRTVRRWLSGRMQPHPDITAYLYRLVCERRDALQGVVPGLIELLREG